MISRRYCSGDSACFQMVIEPPGCRLLAIRPAVLPNPSSTKCNWQAKNHEHNPRPTPNLSFNKWCRMVLGCVDLHPVSITRFPLTRFSPGSGLLRNRFCSLVAAKIFQGLGPKRRESCNGDRVYGLVLCGLSFVRRGRPLNRDRPRSDRTWVALLA